MWRAVRLFAHKTKVNRAAASDEDRRTPEEVDDHWRASQSRISIFNLVLGATGSPIDFGVSSK